MKEFKTSYNLNNLDNQGNFEGLENNQNRESTSKPKLIILTARFPYPLEKGDKLRIFYQIRVLAKKFDIILCALTDEHLHVHDYLEVKKYCTRIYTFHRSFFTIGKNVIQAFFSGLPLQIGYFYDKSIQKEIHAIVKKENPAHIYCQLIRTAEYVRTLKTPKTIDYMDTFSIGATRWLKHANPLLKPILRREVKQLINYENKIFNDFDFHTIISEQDRDYLQTPDNKRIRIVPNGVDMEFFKPMPEVEKEYDIAFVGNMGYVPNVEGAKYLVQTLLPQLIKKYPNIKILIAGARPTALVQSFASKNVTVTGWIEDIRVAYASARIFVAPLFLGSGLQNKILEAMSMSIPCITTTLVNNAIGAKVDKAIVIADDENSFIKKISELLDDTPQIETIGKAGLTFVRNQYSWEHYAAALEECFSVDINNKHPNEKIPTETS